ncbi:methionine ABC transporter substrate-binding protein [Corynebacterium lizhenjunii]|uniref:Methionine ABC transporter substrate-binding protein n=1 Tax=Corynebacterium lizhenjunii TaxID=2709394 RepID=A0A7T0PCE2_9CORY|nr:MetQ/NlpA family ABC transporter substrate-binding protein [Corynebacterium lizhenjunii]QPK79632.1 methionine ABC transporter substrate-binding protein [Corynebacterium lizhenjunii]
MHIRRTLATAVAALAATTLVACSSSDSSTEAGSAESSSPIRIGTTDSNLEEWAIFEELAEEAGYNIKIQNFGDYATPNQALAEDQLDTNKYQHLKYLAEYNKGNNTKLVPLASTEIYPLAIFWKDHSDLKGIEGQTVVIPNDSTNQGRALLVLKQAGLVEFKDSNILTPTPADLDEAKSKVTVTPVDAAQTPTGYNEGRPAIINNSFWGDANVTIEDALFYDDPNNEEAEPYINVWAVRADSVDDKALNDLAKLWKDPKVTAAVLESSGNSAIAVDRPREELQEILERLEKQSS